MSVKINISGTMGLQKALSAISNSVNESEARRILLAAAQPIADTAQRLAPVDQGDLRDSIEVEVETGPGGASVSVGSTSPIAHLVEFGTGGHAQGGQYEGTTHPGTPAQPFLRPAWDAEQRGALDDISRDVWREVQKQARLGGSGRGVSLSKSAKGKT